MDTFFTPLPTNQAAIHEVRHVWDPRFPWHPTQWSRSQSVEYDDLVQEHSTNISDQLTWDEGTAVVETMMTSTRFDLQGSYRAASSLPSNTANHVPTGIHHRLRQSTLLTETGSRKLLRCLLLYVPLPSVDSKRSASLRARQLTHYRSSEHLRSPRK